MSESNCSNSCDSPCFLHKIGNFLQPFLLLAIRLFWGYLLFLSGSAKIADVSATAAFFESLKIPYSEGMSYLVGYTEMIGGICLMVGFLTRLVSLPLIAVMVTAYYTAHHAMDFQASPPFPFFFACLILFAFGAGQISLDYIFQRLFCKK